MFDHWLAPWAGVLGLGMFHGINPGMGWLFAVALGMQERSRRAVWWALVPLTLGHGLAMAAVVALAVALGVAIPASALKWPVAITLAALGAFRLYRHQHVRGSGMRVGMAGHHHAVAGGPDPTAGMAVTALHMAGYLAITAAVAVVVYERLGLHLLRRLWFNLDLIWAVALIGTAAWTVWS
jgi:hypothetical protein